jgi:meso-butanediol dehydrogenase/(S,S)-butanediol dehydrogenase/diacetyl reductase
MGQLDGKVVLITGIARGMGRASALLFAREGAVVAGCDLDAPGADETRVEWDPDGLFHGYLKGAA